MPKIWNMLEGRIITTIVSYDETKSPHVPNNLLHMYLKGLEGNTRLILCTNIAQPSYGAG